MSNSTFKLISERKKEEKKKTEREQRKESRDRFAPRERERSEGTEDRGHGVDVGARRSA